MLDKCSSNCKPILLKQLETIDCRLILTMGKSPTQALLGEKINRYSDYVGKIFDIRIGERDYKLLPIYHPSPLNPKGYKDNIPIFEKIKTFL